MLDGEIDQWNSLIKKRVKKYIYRNISVNLENVQFEMSWKYQIMMRNNIWYQHYASLHVINQTHR